MIEQTAALQRPPTTIRPIAAADIPLLDAYFPEGPADKHSTRMKRQEADHVLYLIAWVGEQQPVGHALIVWGGAEHKDVVAKIKDCPEIDDLYVLPEHRSRGAGTSLLQTAAQATLDRGYRQLGLAVGDKNQRARALYDRCGYQECDLNDVWLAGTWIDREGKEQFWGERCIYMLKPLA